MPLGPLPAEVAQLGQACGGGGAPVGEDGGAQPGGERRVAGDVPGVQQAELRLEVGGGDRAGLGGVRTEWSRAVPVSQTGYQIRSGSAGSSGPSCSSSTSRSLRGESSPRP